MAVNSYRKDEEHIEKSKRETLIRLFSYLLEYKLQIIGVLLLMGYCVAISLVNPLIIETAIDRYIGGGDYPGLVKLLLFALALSLL